MIAGNQDGSVDALANGKFGLLVNPANQTEITNGVQKVLENRTQYIPNHNEVIEYFGYDNYKKNLLKALDFN